MGHLGAWAGARLGNNISAGKRRSWRATLAESARGAVRTKGSHFAAFHRTHAACTGYKGAILATAHKLLCRAYAALRNDHHYRDPATNFEQLQVKRSAPRWPSKLRKFGYLPALAQPA